MFSKSYKIYLLKSRSLTIASSFSLTRLPSIEILDEDILSGRSNKISSRSHIAKDIFKNISKHTVNRRLKKLADKKYIETKASKSNNGPIYIYSITTKSEKIIRENYPYKITEKIFS